MARFRVLYLDETKCKAYQSKAPRKPPYVLTRSNYRDGPEVSAQTPYEAWQMLRDDPERAAPGGAKPMAVGDALEAEGRLLVCNFWGFDPAKWRGGSSKGARGKAT